jgi:hypothetical protein
VASTQQDGATEQRSEKESRPTHFGPPGRAPLKSSFRAFKARAALLYAASDAREQAFPR